MKAIVCGTRFGQVYLESFRRPGGPFELAGVLAGGSERSIRCARRLGVPLYTRPDQLPADIDAACVVIRSGLLGGRGSDLAMALMARGISVLQEHPLHQDELAACLRQARRHHVVYHLNSFYVHVAPVRRFVAAARELVARQPVRYIDAACGFQLAYSLLDILGQALGGVRPWGFEGLVPLTDPIRRLTTLDIPFRGLEGVLAGAPVTLRVQNQLDPADPDNYAHLMHRITIGTEAGNLTLVGTHGPTVWSLRPDFPREVAGSSATPHFEADVGGADEHSATVLGPAEVPPFSEVFATLWPAAVTRALTVLRDAIESGEDPLRRGQAHLTLCQLWGDITQRIGPPELVSAPPPRPLTPADIASMIAAGDIAAGDIAAGDIAAGDGAARPAGVEAARIVAGNGVAR